MLSDEERKCLTAHEIDWYCVFSVGSSTHNYTAARALESLARSRLAYKKAREAAMLYRDASPIHDTKDADSLLAAAEQLANGENNVRAA